MATLKTTAKAFLISGLLLAGSMSTAARADHNHHSVLPYIAIGVVASLWHHNSHRHHRTIKHRYRYSSGHGHGGHYGHKRHQQTA